MRKDKSSIIIGLFVVVAVFIGSAAVVWLGVSHYLTAGERYVTYFDESVQGLSADSAVKYRGVTVGRVENISIAPDERHIEVIMKIKMDINPAETTVAQLRPVGITGIVFVELNMKEEGDVETGGEIFFEAPYPVIPSRPSGLTELSTRLYALADKMMEIDVVAVTKEIEAVASTLREVVGDPRIGDLIENLNAAAVRLRGVLDGLEDALAREDPGQIMAEVRETLGELRSLMVEARETIHEANLPEISKQTIEAVDTLERKAAILMDRLDCTSRVTALEIRDAGFQVREAARAMEDLSERLSLQPSDLFFGRPPDPDLERE